MKRFLMLLATPILLQSCSSMYIPSVRSIPLLENKGEFQGEAGVSVNSVYVNGSYAFSDNIAAAISGNMSYGNFSDYYDLYTSKSEPERGVGGFYTPIHDSKGQFNHRYGEVSVGKINMLPSSTSRRLELFGGAGIGRATDVDLDYFRSDYCSFFGQGNFGLKKRVVETGVSIRLAYSLFNYAIDRHDHSEVLFQSKFNAIHMEPMGFTRLGGGNVKFVFRYGFNLALNNSMDECNGRRGFNATVGSNDWEHTIFHFSVGLSYRFPNDHRNAIQK